MTVPLVVHVIHHLVTGGMENGLVNIVNAMPADRYRHAIVCVEDFNEFRERIRRPDVEVIALHRSRIGTWALRRELFRLFRRLKPAIVHSRNQSGLDALLPALLAGVPRRVHGEHGWDVNDLEGRRRKPRLLRQLHAPLVDRWVTVSRHLERFLVDRVGIAGAKVEQIYNGVDTDRFRPPASRPLAWLPEGFRREDLLLVGTVGRIQPVKDQATLLRAFAQARQADPALRERGRLAVVGDGPLLASLKALAGELGIADGTHFTGALRDVPSVLGAFDVFVLPSLAEGISNTILEAMASGVPVQASAVGGNVELLGPDTGGGLFTPGDVATLAGRLSAYAADPQRRVAEGRAARAAVEQRFSLPAMVDRYRVLYDTLR